MGRGDGRDAAAADPGGRAATAMTLAVRALRVRRGARDVLRGVDLDVAPGELCALMGASGAGKTTVLRAIAGLQRFDGGTIAVKEVELRANAPIRSPVFAALRRHVAMVFQAHALFEHLTAIENVTLALVHVRRWDRARAMARADALLADLGVGARARALPRELSGGEAQRVAIARALAMEPALLLMDEPTAALDPARRGALGERLRALAEQDGRALLVSTHDLEFARAFAHRVVTLADGEVQMFAP